MEQDFQTSFIPKKPLVEERVTTSRPVGFVTVFSIFIFFTAFLISGGLYFYQTILTKKIDGQKKSLDAAQGSFEKTKIIELQLLDKTLRASNEILSKHITISPIFKLLENITMKNIRYTKFDYEFDPKKDSKLKVKMSGQALGYRSIALQSDIFTQNQNLIDPVFSNLSLDTIGNILFDLEFFVDKDFINYKKNFLVKDSN
jgi:hypothetical protein